jgi:hypothetical protein
MFSDELRLMVQPVRGYRQIVAEPLLAPGPLVFRRVGLLLLVVGATVSFASAGRLVLAHLVFVPISWLAFPALQLCGVTGALRLVRQRPPGLQAQALYLAGNGPFLLALLAVAGILLLAPDVAAAFSWLFSSGILVLMAMGAMVWSWLTSWAFYRVCTESTPGKAARLVVVEWAIKIGLALVWYQAIDNLLPQFVGTR